VAATAGVYTSTEARRGGAPATASPPTTQSLLRIPAIVNAEIQRIVNTAIAIVNGAKRRWQVHLSVLEPSFHREGPFSTIR
jgi:hypothetical protein